MQSHSNKLSGDGSARIRALLSKRMATQYCCCASAVCMCVSGVHVCGWASGDHKQQGCLPQLLYSYCLRQVSHRKRAHHLASLACPDPAPLLPAHACFPMRLRSEQVPMAAQAQQALPTEPSLPLKTALLTLQKDFWIQMVGNSTHCSTLSEVPCHHPLPYLGFHNSRRLLCNIFVHCYMVAMCFRTYLLSNWHAG